MVVEPVKLPEKSKGGIVINVEGTMNERLERAGRMLGVVQAIGPQCWKAHAASLADVVEERDPALGPWCQVGDTVMYARHAGKFMFDPMQEDMRELYVVNDDDIIAVLPPQSEWVLDVTDIVTF